MRQIVRLLGCPSVRPSDHPHTTHIRDIVKINYLQHFYGSWLSCHILSPQMTTLWWWWRWSTWCSWSEMGSTNERCRMKMPPHHATYPYSEPRRIRQALLTNEGSFAKWLYWRAMDEVDWSGCRRGIFKSKWVFINNHFTFSYGLLIVSKQTRHYRTETGLLR